LVLVEKIGCHSLLVVDMLEEGRRVQNLEEGRMVAGVAVLGKLGVVVGVGIVVVEGVGIVVEVELHILVLALLLPRVQA
jgi:hypothetical protein